MTIHQKILLLLLISVSLYTVLGTAFQRLIILPSFVALEAEEAEKDMRRCLDALEHEIYYLNIYCHDWAAWDDTYDFVESRSEDYIRSNLDPSYVAENYLSLIYFFDREGGIAWGQFYDPATGAVEAFPDFPETGLAATHRLLNPGGWEDSVHGILQSSRGPLLIAARPILPSVPRTGGEPRGTLLMGRLLDNRIADKLREQTQVPLEIYPVGGASAPPESATLQPGEIRVIYDSKADLRVLANVADLDGAPALAFVAPMPRSILARGRAAIHLQTMAAAAAGLLFALLLSLSMRGMITRPLQQLGEQVRALGRKTPPELSPLLRRGDEIGRLARDFQFMVRRIHEEESERNVIEADLRDSQARLETILQTAPDAIVVTNGKGCIDSANDASARLLGYPVEELIGMRGRDLLAESERDYWVKAVADFARAPTETPFTANRESAILHRDGTVHPVHMCVGSVMLNGKPHFISAIRDISGAKAMQASVERARHLATIGEMGATVAHEIRNPLAGMRGAIDLLQEGHLPPAGQRQALDGLSEAVDRIARIVDQLLQYAKPLTPRPDHFLLRPLVEAVVEGRINGQAEGPSVAIDCPPDLQVYADPNLLRQVLENLWSNACHAAGPGGHLVWAAAPRDGAIAISLADDGPGIDPAHRGRLFEPFFTTRLEGTGLGLSITYRIVEAHRGSISLEDNLPVGTRAIICLPTGEH